jgi:hypothetical protein
MDDMIICYFIRALRLSGWWTSDRLVISRGKVKKPAPDLLSYGMVLYKCDVNCKFHICPLLSKNINFNTSQNVLQLNFTVYNLDINFVLYLLLCKK